MEMNRLISSASKVSVLINYCVVAPVSNLTIRSIRIYSLISSVKPLKYVINEARSNPTNVKMPKMNNDILLDLVSKNR